MSCRDCRARLFPKNNTYPHKSFFGSIKTTENIMEPQRTSQKLKNHPRLNSHRLNSARDGSKTPRLLMSPTSAVNRAWRCYENTQHLPNVSDVAGRPSLLGAWTGARAFDEATHASTYALTHVRMHPHTHLHMCSMRERVPGT